MESIDMVLKNTSQPHKIVINTNISSKFLASLLNIE